MRFLAFFLMLLLLLIGSATTQARHETARQTHPTGALNCAQQENMLLSQGRPSQNAQLIASTNIPVGSNSSPQPITQDNSTVYVVQPTDTLAQIAVRHNVTVYEIVQANQLNNPNIIIRGQRLIIPVKGEVIVQQVASNVKRIFAPLYDVWMDGEPVQGEALLIWLRAAPGTMVSARLGEQTINFRPYCNLLWGIVAFDALWDNPGTHNLVVRSIAYNNRRTITTIPIYLKAGNFWSGPPVNFPHYKQHLQEPELIRSENEKLNKILADLPDSDPRWNGPFKYPVDSMMTGPFGARGVVDGKPIGYHEGLDLRCWYDSPFYAPAPGTVVVAEPLTVRGGTIYVDHGAGVTSGYFHLNQLYVKVGDEVQMGQMLGRCGDTGLTTAPHLHWEIRVNTQWVNPLTWVTRSFP